MPQNHPTTRTRDDTPTDYDALARWAESDAGEDAIAAALSRPFTPAEKALAEEHFAVVRRVLAEDRNDAD